MKRATIAAVIFAVGTAVSQIAWAAGDTSEVPFQLYRGFAIVVRGSIGNVKNLNFLIDTGAVPSVLDRRIAQKLHLRGTPEKVSVFTQKLDAELGVAPSIQLGPHQVDAMPVMIRDLSFLKGALGTRVDAMIGLDFLNKGPFTIDYPCKKIVFGPIDPSLVAIQYQERTGYAVVEMQVQQKKLLLLVDTGASNLVFFEGVMHDLPGSIKNVRTRTAWNMGGEIRVQQVELRDAYLGSTPWGSQDVLILQDTGANQPPDMRGLLGVASLKARRVAFDPDRKVFAWD